MVVRGLPEGRKLAIKMALEAASSEEEEQFYVEHRYHGYLIGPGGRYVHMCVYVCIYIYVYV
jgi:hypothetical protein